MARLAAEYGPPTRSASVPTMSSKIGIFLTGHPVLPLLRGAGERFWKGRPEGRISAFEAFLSVFFRVSRAFVAILVSPATQNAPNTLQKAPQLPSRGPQRRPGRCPRGRAAHPPSPFCPSRRKSAIWRKMWCE